MALKIRNVCQQILFILLAASGASAQIEWRELLPTVSGGFTYRYYTVACYGDRCLIASRRERADPLELRITLFTSADHGQTWKELPAPGWLTSSIEDDALRHIQYVDSQFVFGGTDKGLFVVSTNGGTDWEASKVPGQPPIVDLHFSSSDTGIVACYDALFTTFDRGRTWQRAEVGKQLLWQCYSYGGQKFGAYGHGAGPIYYTADNWVTMDSGSMIFDPQEFSGLVPFCSFSNGDTILAHGRTPFGGVIFRSTDRGDSWTNLDVPRFFSGDIGTIVRSDRAICAGAWGDYPFIFSLDNGETWNRDSMHVTPEVRPHYIAKLAMPSENTVLALAAEEGYLSQSRVLLGRFGSKGVQAYERIIHNSRVYPNPARGTIRIYTPGFGNRARIIDLLGRVLFESLVPADGNLTVDISDFPRGVFSLQLSIENRVVPIAKIIAVD